MTWHADRGLLTGYANGRLGRAQASSVEAHLMGCAMCRAELAPLADEERLERNLAAIVAVVDRPARRWPERLLVRCGVSDRHTRLVAIVPGARDPWLTSIAIVLVLAASWAAIDGSTREAYLFLVSAPLLAVAAVAAVFATRDDPAREVIVATPMAGLQLLLVRWTAVVMPAFALTGLFAIAVPHIGWTAMGWLLPSVCMAAVTMSLASWLPVRGVAAAVGGVWIAVAAWNALGAAPDELVERFVAFSPAGQAVLAIATGAAAAVLVVRRERFETGWASGGLR
ncbi:MAG: hypothetical protein ABIO83_11345 [Ilumatobacteraceae bacterium]